MCQVVAEENSFDGYALQDENGEDIITEAEDDADDVVLDDEEL